MKNKNILNFKFKIGDYVKVNTPEFKNEKFKILYCGKYDIGTNFYNLQSIGYFNEQIHGVCECCIKLLKSNKE